MSATHTIESLPAEMLSRIFALHALQQPPRERLRVSNDSYEWSPTKLGWITVTHVCQRWRSVALADTSLWTRIAFCLGQRWVEEMLARAGPAPVIYERLYDRKSDHSFVEREVSTLSKHLAHIKTLILSGQGTDVMVPILHEVLFLPAPHLTHLELTCPPASPLSLSPSFVRENTSHLVQLCLRNVALPCAAWRWDSLRSLEISAVGRSARERMNVPSDAQPPFGFPSENILFSALESMSSIERLKLLGCLPRKHSPADEPMPRSPLHLPFLRTLSLSGLAFQCIDFLNYTKLPALQSLSVDVQPETNRDSDNVPHIHILVGHVSSHLERVQDPLRCLAVQASRSFRFEIRGWTSESIICEEEPCFFLGISYQQRRFRPDETRMQQVGILRHIPVASVQSLRLNAQGWDANQWREVCSRFTSAEDVRVVLSVGSTIPFVDILYNEPSAHADVDEAAVVIFPSLVSLELEGLWFPSSRYPGYSDSRLSDRQLLLALKQRRSAGTGPHVIRLRKCKGLDDHTLDGLKEIVPVLDWDGLGLANLIHFKDGHATIILC